MAQFAGILQAQTQDEWNGDGSPLVGRKIIRHLSRTVATQISFEHGGLNNAWIKSNYGYAMFLQLLGQNPC